MLNVKAQAKSADPASWERLNAYILDAEHQAAALALRQQHRACAGALAAYYRTRMRVERASGLRGVLRQDSIQHVASKWREDHAEALPVLRGRRQRATHRDADVLAVGDAGQAHHILYRRLRSAVRSNGAVIYRVPGGGVVADEASQVRVTQATTAAALLALSLAVDRFGGRPLVVRGTEDFRRQATILAGQQGLSVTFEDRALEAKRQSSRGDQGGVAARSRGREAQNDAEQGR